MQRGRRRGRGNPNPVRSTSRRGGSSRSSSRRITPRTGRRASSLRRSARIAQLLNGDLETAAAESSMADVARPRALGNRTPGRSRHQAGRASRGSRSGRRSLSPEDFRYAMDVILQPRATVQAGEILTPMIVRLRTLNADPDDAVADSTNLVALATLLPGPNTSGSTDANVLNTVLAGTRFESIRPFSDDQADGMPFSIDMDDPRGVGYMYFNGLVIRQAGTYRIRITLIRMQSLSTDPPIASGGTSVQVVDSNPIVVHGSGTINNMAYYNGDEEDDPDDGGWLEVLRTIQERRRSRG